MFRLSYYHFGAFAKWSGKYASAKELRLAVNTDEQRFKNMSWVGSTTLLIASFSLILTEFFNKSFNSCRKTILVRNYKGLCFYFNVERFLLWKYERYDVHCDDPLCNTWQLQLKVHFQSSYNQHNGSSSIKTLTIHIACNFH